MATGGHVEGLRLPNNPSNRAPKNGQPKLGPDGTAHCATIATFVSDTSASCAKSVRRNLARPSRNSRTRSNSLLGSSNLGSSCQLAKETDPEIKSPLQKAAELKKNKNTAVTKELPLKDQRAKL
eukprot:4436687-Amphidinium_carterae.1